MVDEEFYCISESRAEAEGISTGCKTYSEIGTEIWLLMLQDINEQNLECILKLKRMWKNLPNITVDIRYLAH